jgi:hypothetical protein
MDHRYFRELQTILRDGWDYQVTQPVHSSLVLMSRDGTPLAAVSFVYSERSDKQPLLVHRPKGQAADFQCLFPRDNEEFKIVISNLTPGNIKIDVGRNNQAVDETDPGAVKGYLNDVNELTAWQSYEILGDQKNSLAFKIGTVVQNGRRITVTEDEGSSERKGTFYFISVVPRNDNQEVINLFSDTYWHCPEYFIVRKKHVSTRGFFQESFALGGGVRAASVGGQQYLRMSSRREEVSLLQAEEDCDADDLFEDSMDDGVRAEESSQAVTKSLRVDTRSFGYAATVTGGRVVDTRGKRTGSSYVYNVSSNISDQLCCVSLSIASALILSDPIEKEEILTLARYQINDMAAGSTQSLLEKFRKEGGRVYRESQCVICLEDNNDAIIYRCGHQCVHMTCIQNERRCPMCRSPVVALIDAALAPQ